MTPRASLSLAAEDAPAVARLKVQCPAKVNLFLEVTGKRRDGYHNLATLFAKINLFDTLDLEAIGKPVECIHLTAQDNSCQSSQPRHEKERR